jgi:hypothetical protein
MTVDRFHEGEQSLQERFGTRRALASHERELFAGRALTGNAARFVGSLPLVAIATREEDGWPFPSLEQGPWEIAGTEEVRLGGVRDAERLSRHLARHPKAGTLAIDLHRRFRFRINGRAHMEGEGLRLQVEHAFGNCRKYLHELVPGRRVPGTPAMEAWRSSLDGGDSDAVGRATHAFIATQDADGDLDAQYKGGVPGWLVVEDPETLLWPDYPGNGFFMSLGNLQQDPRLGLLVPSGLLLQGLAEVVEAPALVARFPAAERAVRFHVRRVARARHLAPDEQQVAALSPTFAELGLGEAVGPLA